MVDDGIDVLEQKMARESASSPKPSQYVHALPNHQHLTIININIFAALRHNNDPETAIS